jgi:hypothetical protein
MQCKATEKAKLFHPKEDFGLNALHMTAPTKRTSMVTAFSLKILSKHCKIY